MLAFCSVAQHLRRFLPVSLFSFFCYLATYNCLPLAFVKQIYVPDFTGFYAASSDYVVHLRLSKLCLRPLSTKLLLYPGFLYGHIVIIERFLLLRPFHGVSLSE